MNLVFIEDKNGNKVLPITSFSSVRDTNGNNLNLVLLTKVNSSEKGLNNGIATLDNNGKIPSSQLPSYVDDVIEGYYHNSKFYEDSNYTTEITSESGKIYIDKTTEKTYRWGGSVYVEIGSSDIEGIIIGSGNLITPSQGVITIPPYESGALVNPSNATASTSGIGGSAGLLSAQDKEKLDSLAVLILSDWSLTNNSAKDYIKNKPSNIAYFLNDSGEGVVPDNSGSGGSAYVPTLQSAPTSSTTTYTKDGSTVDFEIGQFCRVLNQGSYDFYQLYDLQEVSNVKTATWEKQENIYAGHEDVYIAVTVDSGAPSGTTISGLVINAYYNDASVPTATVTTDANGMAVLRVPNGYKYRLVFPSQTGCETPWDVVHTAAVSQRSVEVEYEKYEVTEGESVKVVVSQNSSGTFSKVADLVVTVTYDGISNNYTTNSLGEVTFLVPYGKQYTVTVPQRTNWYLWGNRNTERFTSEQTVRLVDFLYTLYETGIFVVASDGAEFLLDDWEAVVQAGTRQNSEAMLIKVATSNLCEAGGVLALDIDMLRERTYVEKIWQKPQVALTSIPLDGNSVSASYYYDGLTASRLVQQEGDDRGFDTPAFDTALAYSRVLAVGTAGERTLPGFIASVGQWSAIWSNVVLIDDILKSTRPNGTYLLSTLTSGKWTCTQSSATSAYRWEESAQGSTTASGKNFTRIVIPAFAI